MADRNTPISVWSFYDAPENLRGLSPHGGDEDWLALVPPHLANQWIPWLETGPFGVCEISEHDWNNGWKVFIGAHA